MEPKSFIPKLLKDPERKLLKDSPRKIFYRSDINTTLQVHTHATEKMAERSVEIFEKAASL